MDTAPTSTTEVDPIAEISSHEETKTLSAQELLEVGIKLGTSTPPSFDEANFHLRRALESSIAQYGDLHIDAAKFYVAYGKMLWESSKGSTDIFASIENEAEGTEEENKDDGLNGDDDPKTTKPVDDASLEADLVEPRELAWELLETARLIYLKAEPRRWVDIGDIYNLLGDISVEDGNFDLGYWEYTEAIKIFGSVLDISDRRLAHAHRLAGACAYYDQQLETAIFHYTAAAEGFNMGLTYILVHEGVLQLDIEETEDIEFVDEGILESIKEKKEVYKEAIILNGFVKDLIERIGDILDQIQVDAENPELKNIMGELAKKLAGKMNEVENIVAEKELNGEIDETADEAKVVDQANSDAAKVVDQVNSDAAAPKDEIKGVEQTGINEQVGFDKPISDVHVTDLGTFGNGVGMKRMLSAEDTASEEISFKRKRH